MCSGGTRSVLQATVGRFDVNCPICKYPHLALSFEGNQSHSLVGYATLSPLSSDDHRWRFSFSAHDQESFTEMLARLSNHCLWTRGVSFERLAEPCLMKAAQIVQETLNDVTLSDALTLVSCLAVYVLEASADVCRHALVVGDRLCTTLALAPPGLGQTRKAGLLSVAELLLPAQEHLAKVSEVLPVDLALLEAAPDEPVLSLDELNALTDWKTVTCERPRARRRWQHLLFVSHVWPQPTTPGDAQDRKPGDMDDLRNIQAMVNGYVKDKLAELSRNPNPRVKATKPDDFGVWIDYMMVPNDFRHGGRTDDCPNCMRLKQDAIRRINALLTLATVLAYNPKRERGWILQELSLNAHAESSEGKLLTHLTHRDRIELMLSQVEFSDDADGVRLRCYEFLRLAQTPRVWPAVNLKLLDRWEEEGQSDEGSAAAWQTLTTYARSFELDCHRIKRFMAELPQEMALANPTEVVDLSDVAAAIDEQGAAMEQLAQRIAAGDVPGEPSDPNGIFGPGMSVVERMLATRTLQLRQLVAAGMGLRAERRCGAGLAGWVSLTVLTEALTAVKFMGRLKGGRVIAHPATSNVALFGSSAPSQLFACAQDVATNGVGGDALAKAYLDD